MHTKLFLIAIVAVIAGSTVSAEEHQSTPKDFEDFVEAFRGRWVGDVTWASDNLGKRGESVTAYFDGRPINNGMAYHGTFYGGENTGTWTVYYDAGAKQIRSLWLNSVGLVSHNLLWLEDGQWMEKGEGSDADGAKVTSMETVTISKDGNVHTWTGTETIGDKPSDPRNNVWRRVSK